MAQINKRLGQWSPVQDVGEHSKASLPLLPPSLPPTPPSTSAFGFAIV